MATPAWAGQRRGPGTWNHPQGRLCATGSGGNMAIRRPRTVMQNTRRGSLTLRSESWGLSAQWTPASILNALACCPDRAAVPTRPGTRAQLLTSPGQAYLATPTGETLVCLGQGWHLACGHPQLVVLGAQRQPPKSPRSRSTPSDARPPHQCPAARRLSGPEGEPRLAPPAPPRAASHGRKKHSLKLTAALLQPLG